MRIMWKLRTGPPSSRPRRDSVRHAVRDNRPACGKDYGGAGRWIFAEGEPTCVDCIRITSGKDKPGINPD